MFFAIEETLRAVDREDLKGRQFVAVMTFEEWQKKKDSLEIGIDMDPDLSETGSSGHLYDKGGSKLRFAYRYFCDSRQEEPLG